MYENLGLIRSYILKLGVMVCICSYIVEEVGIGRFLGFSSKLVQFIGEFQVIEYIFVLEIKMDGFWGVLFEVVF